ncbi:MAG: molybdate ABC transporter substrate-binding protein [Dehalococcoidia bacterium]|nr:molybdate ABC transporter substrate-binding protein [Dehalococcoidia bacterium]
MMRLRRHSLALVVGLLSVAVVSCGDDGSSDANEGALAGNVVISAASSLTDAFTELAETFEGMHEGVTIELNFGSSSSLASQIVEGAPAGVFASANQAQMQVVADAGLANDPQVFAQNRIVVVTPADNETVQTFADIAADGVRLVLAGAEVPVGDYARQAIAAADAAEPGFEEAALANLVSEEANVRAVLTKVELGEADAGVVYETDAAISGDAVRVIPIPSEYVSPAVYPIATVGEDPSEVARAFVAYVLSPEGQAILAKYGFSAP